MFNGKTHETNFCKAALEAERPNGLTLDEMLDISNNLHRYEMSFGSDRIVE